MKTHTTILMLTATFIGGCGSKQVYESIQQNARYECQKLPPSAYQECIDQHSESFDLYTQKREEILEEQKK